MNKIKKKIFNVLRNYLLKDITRNLGKIEETDDKIICYVNNKKLKKYKKEKYTSRYMLFLKTKETYGKEVIDIYKIDKPICYVINNMVFNQPLNLYVGEDNNVTFSNCKFNRSISIYNGDEIVLENNEYCVDHKVYSNYVSFCRIHAKTLKIVNDNFINKSIYERETTFGIMVDTDNLEIINSNFDIKKGEEVFSIISKNINIDNSNINCYNPIYIKADEISSIDTIIKSQTEVVIDNKNNNYIMGVTSPKIIYNGMDLSKYHSLDPENMELQNLRISLLEKLRNLRDKCININLSKTVEDTGVVKTKIK